MEEVWVGEWERDGDAEVISHVVVTKPDEDEMTELDQTSLAFLLNEVHDLYCLYCMRYDSDRSADAYIQFSQYHYMSYPTYDCDHPCERAIPTQLSC